MTKNEIYNSFVIEFGKLFPEFNFDEESFNRLYSMATIDLVLFKNNELTFYEFLWCKTFCWLYIITFDYNKPINYLLGNKFYISLYHKCNEKIETINFRC